MQLTERRFAGGDALCSSKNLSEVIAGTSEYYHDGESREQFRRCPQGRRFVVFRLPIPPPTPSVHHRTQREVLMTLLDHFGGEVGANLLQRGVRLSGVMPRRGVQVHTLRKHCCQCYKAGVSQLLLPFIRLCAVLPSQA